MRMITGLLLSQILLAPDGAGGGGGSSSDKLKIKELIEKLKKVDKADQPGLIETAAKEAKLSKEAIDKALKEAGWDLEAKPDNKNDPKEKTAEVSMRHKTPHPHYRRAGVVLTNQFKPYAVTSDQLKILKKDSWVEIAEKAAGGK